MSRRAAMTNDSLSRALDLEWLKRALSQHLWRHGEPIWEVVRLDIGQVWVTPKRTTMLYHVEFATASRESQQQTYVGYQVPADRLAAEAAACHRKCMVQPLLGQAITLLSEANLVLVALPNDRKMRLFTEADVRAWMAQCGYTLVDTGTGRETGIDVLRYVPAKRYTARCRVTVRTADGTAQQVSFIAKQVAGRRKAIELYENLVALNLAWGQQPQSRSSYDRASTHSIGLRLQLPRPLLCDTRKAVVLLEALPGKDVLHALSDLDYTRVFPAVGELLAHVHHLPYQVSKTVSVASELREVQGTLHTVSRTFPALRARLHACYYALAAWQEQSDAVTVLLHGSYRLNHLLVDNDALALVDFDSLRSGHPAYDLANFLASLAYAEVQGWLSSSCRRVISRHVLAGYAAVAPYPVSSTTVLWYYCSLLINKQVHKYVTHRHHDREAKAQRMITRAEAALAVAQRLPAASALVELGERLP